MKKAAKVMGDKILKISTVHQCNCCLGAKTLHPLVSVIDLSHADRPPYTYIKFGFYTVFLQEHACEDFVCGRKSYDYSAGTLIFLSPGDYFNLEKEAYTSKGYILAFHPDLIRCTSLGEHIGEYRFFDYRTDESLHVSSREKQVITDCMLRTQYEIRHGIDRHSQILISKNIELMLDYCLRFYERQFITRNTVNSAVIKNLDLLITDLILTGRIKNDRQTCVSCIAKELHLSPAYFTDMLEHETGITLPAYIRLKCLEAAQVLLRTTDKPVGRIAFELGFPNTQHFCRLFKKMMGSSPGEYKLLN